MRDIPEELAARIESGAAMLCHAWVLRRGDGAVLGFTDHDRDLDIEGVTCRAGSGWTAGAGEGAAVTAGFAFDTPVRFDIDRIEVTLDSFEAGRMAPATLIEIRV